MQPPDEDNRSPSTDDNKTDRDETAKKNLKDMQRRIAPYVRKPITKTTTRSAKWVSPDDDITQFMLRRDDEKTE